MEGGDIATSIQWVLDYAKRSKFTIRPRSMSFQNAQTVPLVKDNLKKRYDKLYDAYRCPNCPDFTKTEVANSDEFCLIGLQLNDERRHLLLEISECQLKCTNNVNHSLQASDKKISSSQAIVIKQAHCSSTATKSSESL
jgi:hypothetical protein